MEIYQQPTFNKGMVTVRQKNASDLSNAYDFVTWCENFTPNKVIGSLIKRDGIAMKHYSMPNSPQQLSVNNFNNAGNPSKYYTDNNMGTLNLSALAGNINENVNPDNLIGVTEISTSRPFATEIPVVMFKDEDYSYIASYYVRRSGETYWSQWNETYNMPNIDMLDEHKNMIRGIINDYDNIGEAMLFVSKKSDTMQPAYPVYVYAYNDGRRYVEHWFRPDNNPPNTDNEYWHVRKNSQAYIMEIGQLEIDILNKHIFKHAPNGSFQYILNSRYGDLYRGFTWRHAYEAGFFNESCFSLTPENTQHVLRTAGWLVNDFKKNVNVVFFQSSNKPFGSMGNKQYNSPDDFYYTIEQLQGTDWLPYENRMGYKRPEFNAEESGWYGHMPYGDTKFTNSTNVIALPIKPMIVSYKSMTNDSITAPVHILRGWANAKNGWDGANNEAYLNSLPEYDQAFGNINPPIIFHYNSDTGRVARHDTVIRTMLPKYMGENMPRPYFAGERIPYVLTAVINGTETELHRDVYVVKEGNRRAINDTILSGTNMHPKDGKIRLFCDGSDLNNEGKRRKFKESFYPSECCWSNTSDSEDRFGNDILELGETVWDAWEPTPATYKDKNDVEYSIGLRGQRSLMPIDTTNGQFYDPFEASGEQYELTINNKKAFVQNYDATPEAGYVYFTLHINANSFDDALNRLPDGLTEFKLYFAEGDATKGLVEHDDQGIVWNYSTQGYMGHRAIEPDSTNYRLVKRFTVSNNEGNKDIQYPAINQSTQGLSGYENTNSWMILNTDDGIGKGIYAVPTHWRNAVPFNEFIPNSDISYYSNIALNFHNLSTPKSNNRNNEDEYFKDLVWYPKFQPFQGEHYEFEMNRWSSDFCLWDYPTSSTRLSENIVDEPWDGLGAGLICTVNGIVVIGDLQDKDLQPDDGIVRFTSIKNNVVLTDVFPANNKFRIGKDKHTALLSWREQLIAFCENGFYKVMVRGVDPSNWVIVDKFEGQGVTCKKHTIVTPQGIIFMNQNGIFITDGQSIQEITVPINNIYRMFSQSQKHGTNILTPYNFKHQFSNGYINGGWLGMEHSEIMYDNVSNEIVAIFKGQYNFLVELVYSLTHKNWFIRTHGKEIFYNKTTTTLSYKTLLRSHFCGNQGISWIANQSVVTTSKSHYTDWLSFYNYINYEHDIYEIDYFNNSNNNIYEFFPDTLDLKITPIWSSIITDTIGDGINDCSAFKLEIAGIPLVYNITSEKGIYERFYLVNRPNMDYNSQHNFIDLFTANFRSTWKRWLLKNSPSGLAPSEVGILNPLSRESYVYNIPHGQLFRRSQLYYEGYELYYLETLLLMYNKLTRRFG